MVRVKDDQGFDLGVLGDRHYLASRFGTIGKVCRYAVVGAPGWMRATVQTIGPLMPLEIRAFAAKTDPARAWASAG